MCKKASLKQWHGTEHLCGSDPEQLARSFSFHLHKVLRNLALANVCYSIQKQIYSNFDLT